MERTEIFALTYHLKLVLNNYMRDDMVELITEIDGIYRFEIGDRIFVEIQKDVLDKRVADARKKNKGTI